MHAADIPVLELDGPDVRGVIADACRAAVAADGSDAIVLGCAGMAGLCGYLDREQYTGPPGGFGTDDTSRINNRGVV